MAGVIAPLFFVGCWIVAGKIRDGYDPVTDAISRLAELGAPDRWLVTTGMYVFGIGCIVFAPMLKSRAAAALTVAGIASFGVATFPCTAGCPGTGSFTDVAHGVAAGAHYVAFALAPWFHDRRALPWSAAASVALLIHAAGIGPNGLLQRTGLTILDAWLVLVAISFLRGEKSAD